MRPVDMTTTNETVVTRAQLRALRDEAMAAGDVVQVALCRVALGLAWETGDGEDDSRARVGMERNGVIPEHVDADVRAAAECARVIAAAAAQAGVAS